MSKILGGLGLGKSGTGGGSTSPTAKAATS